MNNKNIVEDNTSMVLELIGLKIKNFQLRKQVESLNKAIIGKKNEMESLNLIKKKLETILSPDSK